MKQLIVGLLVLSGMWSACSAPQKTAGGVFAPVSTDGEYGSSQHSPKADSLAMTRVFIDACRARSLGDDEGAVELFREVLQIDPLNDAALFELGKIYFEYGKLDDARELLRLATEQDPANTYYLETYGSALLYLAQYREAIEIYQQLLHIRPDDMDAAFQLAFSFERAGSIEESLSYLRQMEQQFGPDESILMEEYRLFLRNGMLQEGIDVLLRLIENNPDEPVYVSMLADVYELADQSELAEATFDKLLEIDPDNADLQFKKASYQIRSGDREAYWNTLRKVFCNNRASIDKKVFFLVPYVDSVDKKNFTDKDSILEMARLMTIAHPTEAKAWAMQGDLLYYAGQKTTARESFLKSTDIRADVYDVWVKMFYIDAEEERWDSLQAVTTRSIELFPNQALGYYFNGVSFQQTKAYDQAVTMYKRSIPMSVGNNQLRAEIWLRLGDTYHEMGKHPESDQAYDESLKLDPANPYTLNNYAYYLSLRGEQLDKAADMARKAVRLVPDNPSLLDTYAWVLYRSSMYKEAAQVIEDALRVGGQNSAVVLEHYGDILYQLDRKEEALQYWKKAQEKGAENEKLLRKIRDEKLYE